MKHLKSYEENSEFNIKIDNADIINFAKIYNKEKGYSNKCVYYNNHIKSLYNYVSVADNPYDNFNYIIVGDLQLKQFIKNAKDDGMSTSLYMRALTDKVDKKYNDNKVIVVAIDHNTKIDIAKDEFAHDRIFRSIDDKIIDKILNNSIIIDEGTLIFNKKGEIFKPTKNQDSWAIQYKESDDYIFTNFHSGWSVIMKESDFISKFMKESEYLLNVSKYNI